MEDIARRGPRIEQQWNSSQHSSTSRRVNSDKGDKGNCAMGTGALQVIRSRGSMCRQRKRDSGNRNKSSEGQTTALDADETGGNTGGGGFGKWLRDHLGGGSRGNQDIVPSIPSKNRSCDASYDLSFTRKDKNLTRATYTPQNLYCSLPREHHRRHFHICTTSISKSSYESTRERSRCLPSDGINFQEWKVSNDINGIARGEPINVSEVRSHRRRERERRRHSINETREHSRQKRISFVVKMVDGYGEARTMESQKSSFSNSKPDIRTVISDQEMIRASELEESNQKIWATELTDENSDTGLEEDLIDESKVFNGRKKKDNDTLSYYRELSDLTEESEHEQDTPEVSEIHRTRKYDEDNLEDSNDDYDRVDQEEELYSSVSRLTGREELEEEEDEEEEEEEEEEIVPEEIDRADESDDNYVDVLADIPAEILRDRQAILEKIRELNEVSPELRRKNKLLQYWVARVMTKKQQTMTPENETLNSRESERRYIKRLIGCKITIDEIEARQNHIKIEINNLENSLKRVVEEDDEVLGGLVDREREIGVGLIFEKSGRVINVKAVETMIRRQVLRRDLLKRDRFKYTFHRHIYEDLKMKLRLVETVSEGITVMDYEEIRFLNYSYRDKLEEREKELEKLFVKVQELLNTLNHYKERDIANQSEIYQDECQLEVIRFETMTTREELNQVRKNLLRTRQLCINRKLQGGMLFATPVIREMEKTIKKLNDLNAEVERMVPQVRSHPEEHSREVRSRGTAVPTPSKLQDSGACTTVTRMTKVKRSGPRNRPGRC